MASNVDHIIFLHGRGARRNDDAWLRDGLDPLLQLLDRSVIPSTIEVHRPFFGDLIEPDSDRKARDAQYPAPLHVPFGDELEALREEYELRRRELLKARGRRPPHGARGQLLDRIPGNQAAAVLIRQRMPDVARYVSSHAARRAVMQRLHAELPQQGRIVLFGHSLGSVVALDYLHFLPRDIYVERLVTLGSPLAFRPLRRQLMGQGYNWPWANLGGWINLYDPEDFVTGGEPLEPIFRREVVDVQVDNGKKDVHRSRHYLSHGTLVRMVGPLISEERTTPLPADADAELVDSVLIRALGRRIEAETPTGSERRKKMGKARGFTEDALLEGIQRGRDVRSLAYSIPDVGAWLGSDVARIERLLALFFADPFAPFVTENRSHEQREGIRALGLELGVKPQHIRHLIRAVGDARASHDERDWKSLARTAGIVAIAIAAPFAVPGIGAMAGLSGAAAITHGLAVVGGTVGGGMMAGVGVLGAVSAGGAAFAARQVQSLSTDELVAELVRLQAAAVLEKRLSFGTGGRDSRRALIALNQELKLLAKRHRQVEGQSSKVAASIDEKRVLVKRSLTWVNERFDRADANREL